MINFCPLGAPIVANGVEKRVAKPGVSNNPAGAVSSTVPL
jgi:hypothetical protein